MSLEIRRDTQIIKYADDVFLHSPSQDNKKQEVITERNTEEIKQEVNNMKQWCAQKGLSLNIQKTKLLVFKKKYVHVNLQPTFVPSSEIKLLGVVFHENLLWDSHVAAVCELASQRIYILKQLKKMDFITKKDLLQVYNAYIRSILEYNCPLLIGMTSMRDARSRLLSSL